MSAPNKAINKYRNSHQPLSTKIKASYKTFLGAYPTGYMVIGKPDGNVRIVTMYNNTYVVCLDANGNVLWSLNLGYNVTDIELKDVNNDGKDEIFTGDTGYYIRRIDNGTQVWATSVGNSPYTGLSIEDWDKDGVYEVFGTHYGAVIYNINASTGAIKWSYSTGDVRIANSVTVIDDIDNDGAYEGLTGGRPHIWCMNPNGTVKWSFTGTYDLWSVSVRDVNNDGKKEIYAGDGGYYARCISSSGASIWTVSTNTRFYNGEGTIIADINNDGVYEVVFPNVNSYDPSGLICYNALNGTQIWRTGQWSAGTITGVDLNNDTYIETIYACNISGYYRIEVIKYDGTILWTITTSDGRYFTTAGDINNDGYSEVLVGGATYLYVFSPLIISLSDSFTLSDTIIKSPSKTLSDSASLTDILGASASYIRTFSDTITLSDIIIKSALKELLDSISLTDAIFKSRLKELSDGISLSDVFSRTYNGIREFTDSISLSEVIAKTTSIPLSDAFSLTDVLAKTPIKALVESLSLSDVFSRTAVLTRVLSDSISLSDVFSRQAVYSRLLVDNLVLNDVIVKAIAKSLADTSKLKDVIQRIIRCTYV